MNAPTPATKTDVQRAGVRRTVWIVAGVALAVYVGFLVSVIR